MTHPSQIKVLMLLPVLRKRSQSAQISHKRLTDSLCIRNDSFTTAEVLCSSAVIPAESLAHGTDRRCKAGPIIAITRLAPAHAVGRIRAEICAELSYTESAVYSAPCKKFTHPTQDSAGLLAMESARASIASAIVVAVTIVVLGRSRRVLLRWLWRRRSLSRCCRFGSGRLSRRWFLFGQLHGRYYDCGRRRRCSLSVCR